MLLVQSRRQLTARASLGLALGLAACSLQMPDENEVFGSAGSKSEAPASAGSGAGTRGESGGEDAGGTDSLADGGDSATPDVNGSSGAGGAGASSGAGGSGASSGSKGSAGASGASGAVGTSGASGASGFDPALGLIAYFTFDDPSGAVATNTKDPSKNAKCVGTCTRPTGQLGQAFGLRNDVSPTDWIELPGGILAGHSAITLSVWMRDRSSARVGAPLFHFSAGSKEAFSFTPDDRNAKNSSTGAHLGGVHSSESFVDLWSTKADFLDKNWHHVAISWNADSIELYLDSRAAGSEASPGVLPSQLGTASPNYLGRLPDDSNLALYGEVDDLRVYDRVLSATQIASLYKLR